MAEGSTKCTQTQELEKLQIQSSVAKGALAGNSTWTTS
jgi:hypothetical protein